MATMLGVSVRTNQRRLSEYSLSITDRYADTSDEVLDNHGEPWLNGEEWRSTFPAFPALIPTAHATTRTPDFEADR